MDSIEKTLTATQNLLCALEDSSHVREKDFYEKINSLRENHKVTTKFLEEKCKSKMDSSSFRFLEHATYHSSPGCTHFWSNLNKHSSSQVEKQKSQVPEKGTVNTLSLSKRNQVKINNRSYQKKEEEKEQKNIRNPTTPQPFKFLNRKPLENTYSKKFIKSMLLNEETKKEEEKKLLQSMKHFKANPIPATTYISDNKFVNNPKYIESVQKMVRQRLSSTRRDSKSKSCVELSRICSKPVPLSTYISSIEINKLHREQNQSERANKLLKQAHSPPGIKEHSIKTNIAARLRHKQCIENEQKIKPPKKIPDFQSLHKQAKFDQETKSRQKATLIIPFNFSESRNSKHRRCRSATPPRQFSANPIPATSNYYITTYKTTLATELRAQATRNKINETQNKTVGLYWCSGDDHVKLARNKLMASVKKSQSVSDISKKTKQKRLNMMALTNEYNLQMKEMQERVLNRPLIMEMQTSTSHKNALDRKYRDIMNNIENNSADKPSISDLSHNTFPLNRERTMSLVRNSIKLGDNQTSNESSSPVKTESSRTSISSLSSSASSEKSSSASSSIL